MAPKTTTKSTAPRKRATKAKESDAAPTPLAVAEVPVWRKVPRNAWIAIGATLVAIIVIASLVGGGSGPKRSANDTASRSTETSSDAPADPTDAVAPRASGPSFAGWTEHRDQYFFAALPPGWTVTGATANGIDISPPDGTGTASFAYVHGSVAGASAYGTPTDNAGYADWILSAQGAQNVSMGTANPLGNFTDATGLSWTFDGREFDATKDGAPVHGVLQVGTATDAFGSWIGMAWQRVARADRWDALKDDLSGVARSITILKVQSSGGSIRMPAQDTDTGEMSATQDDVESRLSQQREDATMGGQNLTDPTTGDRYWAPYEAYDESRGGYFIEKSDGAQQLDTDY